MNPTEMFVVIGQDPTPVGKHDPFLDCVVSVVGVYSTLEKAREAIVMFNANREFSPYDEYHIESFYLDDESGLCNPCF